MTPQGDTTMKFRKRPVVIEAVQYLGEENWYEVQNFLLVAYQPEPPRVLGIETLEGTMTVSLGDWIIRGVAGEFYPCKPDIFAATYEPVEP
jgi:hypothetical protein